MKRLLISIFSLVIGITAKPQSAEESLSKGNEYYRLAQYEVAESLYRKALQVTPQSVTARHNLANALYRQKKYKEAEEILKGISTQEKEKNVRSVAYYNTGVLYSRQKDLEESIEAYKDALRLNPEDQQARENLQKALSELKQKQQQQQRDQQQNKSQSKMNQKQAEQKLKELQQKEKEIQERMQNQKSRGGNPMPQDW